MGIRVAQKTPEEQLKEDMELLEGFHDRAGVGTLEVPPDVVRRILLNVPIIIADLHEAEDEADMWMDRLANEEAMVSHLKTQIANLKGQITKLKKRVDKKS